MAGDFYPQSMTPEQAEAIAPREKRIEYGRRFWVAYAAIVLTGLVTAVAAVGRAAGWS